MPTTPPEFDADAPHVKLTVDFGNGDTVINAKVTLLRAHTASTAEGTAAGLDACLEVETVHDGRRVRYFLSRLLGECRWTIDSLYGGDTVVFAHGFGHRAGQLRTVPLPLAGLLDHLASEGGLTGPDGSPGIEDKHGVRHLVAIDRERHDPVTGAGEVAAACLCGWRDAHPFGRADHSTTEDYARLRLTYSASAHLPA